MTSNILFLNQDFQPFMSDIRLLPDERSDSGDEAA